MGLEYEIAKASATTTVRKQRISVVVGGFLQVISFHHAKICSTMLSEKAKSQIDIVGDCIYEFKHHISQLYIPPHPIYIGCSTFIKCGVFLQTKIRYENAMP